jgi:hypothetical protein
MSQPQYISESPPSVAYPPCPKCGAKMMLTRIDPYSPGINRHMFECEGCGHDELTLLKFR